MERGQQKIKSIVVDYGKTYTVVSTESEPITIFSVNGEMAPVPWFRKGNTDYNGKYVISVEHE